MTENKSSETTGKKPAKKSTAAAGKPVTVTYNNTEADIEALKELPVGVIAVSERGSLWRHNTLGWTNVYCAPGERVYRGVGAHLVVREQPVRVFAEVW